MCQSKKCLLKQHFGFWIWCGCMKNTGKVFSSGLLFLSPEQPLVLIGKVSENTFGNGRETDLTLPKIPSNESFPWIHSFIPRSKSQLNLPVSSVPWLQACMWHQMKHSWWHTNTETGRMNGAKHNQMADMSAHEKLQFEAWMNYWWGAHGAQGSRIVFTKVNSPWVMSSNGSVEHILKITPQLQHANY